MPRPLIYFILATAMMWQLLLGRTYYPGDVLYSYPLWYDGVHQTANYDLIDPMALYYPHDLLFNQELKQGRLMTWNPYGFCGHPVFADGKSGWLYPPRLILHFFLSPERAHDLLLWLHLALGGWAMHVFLRRLGLGEIASYAGGSVWILNGMQATWLESEYLTIFGLWVPFALDRLTVGLSGARPRAGPLVAASLGLGLLGLCGLIQFWAHTLLLCGFWVLYLAASQKRWSTLAAGGSALFAALPLVAVQLVPTFELVARSNRLVRPLAHQIECYQNLVKSLPALLLSPDLLGNPARGLAFRFISPNGDWIMLETCFYLGIGGLALALLSLAFRQTPHWRFFAALTLCLLVVPMTPLYWIPFKFLPGFSQTISTRLIFPLSFCFSVLAAYGAHGLQQAHLKLRRRFCLTLGAVSMLWWVCLSALHFGHQALRQSLSDWPSRLLAEGYVRFPFPETYPHPTQLSAVVTQRFFDYYSIHNSAWWYTGLFLTLSTLALLPKFPVKTGTIALIALTAADLILFSSRFNTTADPDFLRTPPPAVQFIQAQPGLHRVVGLGTIRPNTTNPFHLLTLEGHNSIVPRENVMYLNALQNGDPHQTGGPFTERTHPITNFQSPLLSEAATKFAIVNPQHDLSQLGFELLYRQPNGLGVWLNPGARPMVWLASKVERVTDFQEALESLFREHRDPRLVTLESPPDVQTPGQAETSTEPIIQDFHPGYWEIQAEGPGWLVVEEAAAPGWSATVDGEPVRIYRAQALFQAVLLRPGRHTVTLRYHPPGMKLGGWVSGVTLLILLLLLGLTRQGLARDVKNDSIP